MNRWVLALPLAVFGITGISLYVYFIGVSGDDAFQENLLPEIIGFCLEGFFLVGLLSFVQQVREHDRRRELWLSLRGSLREFLSHLDIAFLKAESEPLSSNDLENQPRVVEQLMKHLFQPRRNKNHAGVGHQTSTSRPPRNIHTANS